MAVYKNSVNGTKRQEYKVLCMFRILKSMLLDTKHQSPETFKCHNISIPHRRCDEAVNGEKKWEVYPL
jgi:hypothetical protein